MENRNRTVGDPGWQTGVVLFQQAQAGCRDSLERLMAAHEALVHHIVRQQALGCLSYGEAVQAGRIGLWRAILGFDPQHGLAFSTYAWPAIMHHIWREVNVTCSCQLADILPATGASPLPPASFHIAHHQRRKHQVPPVVAKDDAFVGLAEIVEAGGRQDVRVAVSVEIAGGQAIVT